MEDEQQQHQQQQNEEHQQNQQEQQQDHHEDPMAPPPGMIRALPEVPCPPYAPIPRDQLYIDVPEWPYPVVGGVGNTAHLNNKFNHSMTSDHSTSTSSHHNNNNNRNYVPGQNGFFGLSNIYQNNNNNSNRAEVSSATNGTTVSGGYASSTTNNNNNNGNNTNNGPSSYLREVLESFDPDRSNSHKYPNADRLRQHFKDGGSVAIDDALWIINVANAILLEEPNVLEIKSPVTVCGDIHGQFFDLMTLLDLGGSPSPSETSTGTQYLFLGDYVDRGCFSTEVTLLLLSYKIMYPTSMWLLRGNHECRHLTGYFNFKSECLKKYTEEVYDAFMTCFDALPLAARVDNKFLCVHGGIGPDIKSVEDISLIHRVCEPPPRGPMCDLLWADPMEPDDESAAPGARYLYNDIRSCSYSFSYKASLEFLEANGLLTLIRAHESQFEGYRMFQKVPSTGMPSVICIFSAPNYCEYNNKAAIMLLENHTMKIRQFAAVEHPYVLQNFLNAFTWSLPFLTDKVQQVAGEISALNTELSPGMENERQREYQKLVEQNNSMNASLQQKHGLIHGNNNNNNSKKRPLHNLLSTVKQQQQNKNENHSTTSSLLQLMLRLRSFYLLPKFLRRRGRIVKMKIKAVMYFILVLQKMQQQKNNNKNKNDEQITTKKDSKMEEEKQEGEKKNKNDESSSSDHPPTRSSGNSTSSSSSQKTNGSVKTSSSNHDDDDNESKTSYPLPTNNNSLHDDEDDENGGSRRSSQNSTETTRRVDPMEGVEK